MSALLDHRSPRTAARTAAGTGGSPTLDLAAIDATRPDKLTHATVDIVVPVYNEERTLVASIMRLHAYLTDQFPLPWQITIADNASTDATLLLARGLAHTLDHIGVVHLDAKGRGRALRTAWTKSRADIVAYLDVDLSTDLDGLYPLVAPLVSGHSGIAIGTRLATGSHVVRGAKR